MTTLIELEATMSLIEPEAAMSLIEPEAMTSLKETRAKWQVSHDFSYASLMIDVVIHF